VRSVMIIVMCAFVCSLFGGCSGYDYIIYQPTETSHVENPKDKIRMVLSKQRHLSSGKIEVTDEYIAISPIYYDDIKHAILYNNEDAYVVKLLGRNSVGKLAIISYDFEETKEFIDALAAVGCRLEIFSSE